MILVSVNNVIREVDGSRFMIPAGTTLFSRDHVYGVGCADNVSPPGCEYVILGGVSNNPPESAMNYIFPNLVSGMFLGALFIMIGVTIFAVAAFVKETE